MLAFGRTLIYVVEIEIEIEIRNDKAMDDVLCLDSLLLVVVEELIDMIVV